jgi:hypothetical protein
MPFVFKLLEELLDLVRHDQFLPVVDEFTM